MRSGVRIPFHFEVAETQRFAQAQLKLEEAERAAQLAASQPQQQPAALDAATTSTATAATTAESVLLGASAASSPLPSSSTALAMAPRVKTSAEVTALAAASAAAASAVALQPESGLPTRGPSTNAVSFASEALATITADRQTVSSVFVPTPSEPASLAAFETLVDMPTVERLDAFYEPPKVPMLPFRFTSRWRYLSWFRTDALCVADFLSVDADQAVAVANVYKHLPSGVSVTLLPVVHVAHPSFWRHADELCSQHHSVLMEGRFSPTSCDISVVPPRAKTEIGRPEEEVDAEGWEPSPGNFMANFRQPYGWGVLESDVHTIIHAADAYDYDRLPAWARVRFNFPIVGNYKREKHCLRILHQLTGNGYESFCVPWGAAHMPIFAKMLLQNGFTQCGSSRIVLFNRIDGPISAAYTRKLQSHVNWSRWLTKIVQGAFVLSAFYGFAFYMGMDMAQAVNFTVENDVRAKDPAARRAWDKVMAPTPQQQRLREKA